MQPENKAKTEQPLASILTVVYNGEKHLEKTIQSVITQDYPNIEYVIIDGGSTDRTQEIVAKYKNSIDVFISEPDRGIYHAINKGIEKCQGAVIKIQNADDLLLPGAVSSAMSELQKYNLFHPFILIGNSQVLNQTGDIVGEITEKPIIRGFDSFNHPAWFATGPVYKYYGLYSEEFKVSSDYEYYLRYTSKGGKIIHLPEFLAGYRQDGTSAGMGGIKEVAVINFRYKGALEAVMIGGQHLLGKVLRPIVRGIREVKRVLSKVII